MGRRVAGSWRGTPYTGVVLSFEQVEPPAARFRRPGPYYRATVRFDAPIRGVAEYPFLLRALADGALVHYIVGECIYRTIEEVDDESS